MKRLVFGLDGGGTGSRLRIADDKNHLLVVQTGEGINPHAVGYPVAVERISGLFQKAFQALKDSHGWAIETTDFAAGCFAIAGGGVKEEAEKLETMLREAMEFRCPLVFVSDAEAALVGGLKSLEGMILVSGTGSIAMARLRNGTVVRSGGYGHFLGDEGSAFWIASQAVSRSIRSWEGRDLPTNILSALLKYFSLQTPYEFIPLWYQRFDKARIAGAATIVESFREQEDPLAVDIFLRAAEELAKLVESAFRKIGDKLEVKQLLLWGGQLEHNDWLRRAVIHHLRGKIPGMIVCTAKEDAAFGACLLAIQAVLKAPRTPSPRTPSAPCP